MSDSEGATETGVWSFDLTGDQRLLGYLARHLSGTTKVDRAGDRFVLRSPHLDLIRDPRSARQEAIRITQVLGGAANARTLGRYGKIGVGGAQHSTLGVFMFPEPLEIRIEMGEGTVTIGDQIFSSFDQVGTDVSAALADKKLEFALEVFSDPEALTWAKLYVVYETVENDVGKKRIQGWGFSGKRLSLFTQTAQSPGAVGVEARHGFSASESGAPKPQMHLGDAKELVHQIVIKWLDHSKGGTARD